MEQHLLRQELDADRVERPDLGDLLPVGRAPLTRNLRGGQPAAEADEGDALPSSLRGRLEHALGIDLSPVRVHTGADAAQSSADLGARAWALGQDIHFGAGTYQPDTPAGDWLIAHEVAHTVQQRGAEAAPDNGAGGAGVVQPKLEVSQPGDTLEDQADRFASEFVLGVAPSAITPVPAAVVSRAVVQRNVLTDLGNAAIGFICDRISDAASLASELASLSESVARQVIDWIWANRVEILLTFVAANPAHALIGYVLRKLTREQIQQVLDSAEVQNAVRIVRAIAAAGLLAACGPIIFVLAPDKARAILRELDQAVLTPLFRAAGDAATRFARDILRDLWPVGVGFSVDAGIGATFGIPLYLGADYEMIISRRTDEIVEFTRRGEAREAFDTGVGVGGFAGLGGRGEGGRGGGGGGGGGAEGGGGGLGVGAQAAAEFQAGLKQIILQKFDFPIFTDGAFLSLLIAVTGSDTGAGFMIGSAISSTIAGLDPMRYNTSTRVEFRAYAVGSAGAEAGLRRGNAATDAAEGPERTSTSTGAPARGDELNTPWYVPTSLINASLFGQIRGEAGIAFEFTPKEMAQDPATGRPVPRRMEVSISGEAGAAASITHRIPILSYLVPQLPSFNEALGIRVKFVFGPSGDDPNGPPEYQSHTYEIYSKSGDMDMSTQAGSASETSIGVGNIDEHTFESWDSFLRTVVDARVQRRIGIAAPLGRTVAGRLLRQREISTMLPRDYRDWGLQVQGYLHLDFHFSTEHVRQLFTTIRDLIGTATSRSLQQLYVEVTTFFSTGEAPDYVRTAFNQLIGVLDNALTELRCHVQIGLHAAGGASAAEGAKVRLHGSAGGFITYDNNVKETIAVTAQQLADVLLRPADAAQILTLEPAAIDAADAGAPDPAAAPARHATGELALPAAAAAEVAADGVAGPAAEVPHRAQMEAAFGTSFGDVRAHVGAADATAALSADAYAVGGDVAFASTAPAPDLVAHELAHVVQARQGRDPDEAEAERAAARVGGGRAADVLPATTLSRVEHGLGGAFGDVAIVPDSPRAGTAEALTTGDEVHFAPGRFAPGTPDSDWLLTHELAHVQQQRLGSSAAEQAFDAAAVPGLLEREADRAADAVAAGGRAEIRHAAAPGMVQRFEAYEHTNLGDLGTTGSGDEMVIAVGHPPRLVSYGELVAMSGDFYTTSDGLLNADGAELGRIQDVMRHERAEAASGSIEVYDRRAAIAGGDPRVRVAGAPSDPTMINILFHGARPGSGHGNHEYGDEEHHHGEHGHGEHGHDEHDGEGGWTLPWDGGWHLPWNPRPADEHHDDEHAAAPAGDTGMRAGIEQDQLPPGAAFATNDEGRRIVRLADGQEVDVAMPAEGSAGHSETGERDNADAPGGGSTTASEDAGFLEAAAHNSSHFSPENIEANFKRIHKLALDKAKAAYDKKPGLFSMPAGVREAGEAARAAAPPASTSGDRGALGQEGNAAADADARAAVARGRAAGAGVSLDAPGSDADPAVAEAQNLAREAIVRSAFSVHFLTDAFASGHLVSGREGRNLAVRYWVEKLPAMQAAIRACLQVDMPEAYTAASASGALDPALQFVFGKMSADRATYTGVLLKLVHDQYNQSGLLVSNPAGATFMAYGDANLARSPEAQLQAQAATAEARTRVQEVMATGELREGQGEGDDYGALRFVPSMVQPLFPEGQPMMSIAQFTSGDVSAVTFPAEWDAAALAPDPFANRMYRLIKGNITMLITQADSGGDLIRAAWDLYRMGQGAAEWVGENVVDPVAGGLRRAGELAGQAGDWASENVVDPARRAASGAWDSASETASGAWGWLSDQASGAWDSASEAASGAWDSASEAASGAWDSASETASGAWGWMSDQASGAWGAASDAASGAWDSASGAVSDAWQRTGAADAWDSVSGAASGAWDTVSGAASGAWDTVSGAASGAWDTVSGAASSAWDSLSTGASNLWNRAAERVRRAVVPDWLERMWGERAVRREEAERAAGVAPGESTDASVTPLDNQTYAHGAFMGAAGRFLQDPLWHQIYQRLMPEHCARADAITDLPSLELHLENNPVLAAYGEAAHMLEASGGANTTANASETRAVRMEWDVWLDPTHPEDLNLARIAHGDTVSTIGNRAPVVGPLVAMRDDVAAQPSATGWIGLFGRAIQMYRVAQAGGGGEATDEAETARRDAAWRRLMAPTAGAEALSVCKEFFGGGASGDGGVILDVKSSYSTPPQIQAFIDAVEATGINVFGVGSFGQDQLEGLTSVETVRFFHGLSDLTRADDLPTGQRVMFNAGDLLVQSVDGSQNDAEPPGPIDPAASDPAARRPRTTYGVDRARMQQLVAVKKQRSLQLGLYVQEPAVSPRAIDAITQMVNDRPEVFELGFAHGNTSGHTEGGTEGSGVGAQGDLIDASRAMGGGRGE